MTPTLVPVNDFSLYWVAAKQLFSGQNPYVPASGHGLVQLFSMVNNEPLVMFGPPWTFPVIAWLGFFPFQVAQFLWTMTSVTCLAVSVIWLWELYGEGRNLLWAGLLTATFLPVLATFLLAQIGPLILLGIAGFLRYEGRRPYLAGVFLYLAALKPQLALLLWPALVFYAIRGYWKSLLAFFASFGAANLFALVLRPTIFRDYWAMLQGHRVAFYDTPTIGALLRHASGHELLQWILAGLALLWFAWYWPTRLRWEWKSEFPLLLLISMVAAPYAWFSDQIILLPALFCATSRVWHQSPVRILTTTAAYFGVSGAALVFVANREMSFYAWIAVAWLILYGITAMPGPRHVRKSPLLGVPNL